MRGQATLALALAATLAAPGHTQDAAGMAEAAIAALHTAGADLAAARGAGDRVAALSRVIGAYETGLAALRDGLRQTTIREAALRRAFERDRERIARLLGVLGSFDTAPESLLLVHPDGPLAAIRAGMLLAEATPRLQDEAQALRGQIDDLRILHAVQETALDTLHDSLRAVQDARSELSAARSARQPLPARLADDAEAVARLAASADTLTTFAKALAALPADDAAPGADLAAGGLALPVAGRVIRRFGEPDAAGIERPGILIATEPRALVTAPVAATIRYLGPLLDYGNVMILEPAPDSLLVLAGLGEVYGQPGEVVAAGAPVGLMGGNAPTDTEFLAGARNGTGAPRSETLYLEARRGGAPVDPAGWFAEPLAGPAPGIETGTDAGTDAGTRDAQ